MPQNHHDLIITARWMITVENDGEVLENHSVVINDGKITAILPATQAANLVATRRIQLDSHVLMPGLSICMGTRP